MAGGTGIWYALKAYLENCLSEAEQGLWNEITPAGCHTCPMNPKIAECFSTMGFDRDAIDNAGKEDGKYSATGDQLAWCAAFAGTVLKACGSTYLANNLSAVAYNNNSWGAKPIGQRKYKQWREFDLLVKSSTEGHSHVGFVRKVDPKNNKFILTGGNQGDTVCNAVYFNLSTVYNVFRAWEIPSEADVSIVGTITEEVGNQKQL